MVLKIQKLGIDFFPRGSVKEGDRKRVQLEIRQVFFSLFFFSRFTPLPAAETQPAYPEPFILAQCIH